MPTAPRLIPAERIRHTLGTLVFATLVCGGMLIVRELCAGNHRFDYLFYNLMLAWIPLALALFMWGLGKSGGRLLFGTSMILWILFFPNSFYIVTDLVHSKKFGTDGIFHWFDLIMNTGFATGGMFLGCLSLYLLHLFVRHRFGWRAGWGFAGGMLALGSFGIYLGRVLRLNSWDVANPAKLVDKIATLTEPSSAKEVAAFSLTFFFFSLAVYTFVVSIARLHEQPVVGQVDEGK